MTIAKTKLFSSALALLFLSACTTLMYEGLALPDAEVAIVRGDRMTIATIDGKAVPYSGGNYATIKVLPGPHTISARLNDVRGNSTRSSKFEPTLSFYAAAGRQYVIRPAYVNTNWRPEVIEVSTGNVVSRSES
jgi:hypothetical protein